MLVLIIDNNLINHINIIAVLFSAMLARCFATKRRAIL
jgi:hypothetical protein